MKSKLLKKLRKKYTWYFNQNNKPVLLDHSQQKATVFSLEYCLKLYNYRSFSESGIEVSPDVWCYRVFLNTLLKPYGWDFEKRSYKKLLRKMKK